jgi:hypothetical protein
MPVAVPPSLVAKSADIAPDAKCGMVEIMLKSKTAVTKPKQTLEDFPSITFCKNILHDKRSGMYDGLQTVNVRNLVSCNNSNELTSNKIIIIEISSIKTFWKVLLSHKKDA